MPGNPVIVFTSDHYDCSAEFIQEYEIISTVAYFKVVDAVNSVFANEDVYAAIDEIAQTTLGKVVGKHTRDEPLAETGCPNGPDSLV